MSHELVNASVQNKAAIDNMILRSSIRFIPYD